MNLSRVISMGLSMTSIIEFIILLLFFFIFCFWFAFLILLCFCAFIAFKIWKFIQQQQKANRSTIFNQGIPTIMKAAYYSNSWSKIIDFGEYELPVISGPDELLIKVHSASLNPVDYKLIFTRIPFYRWVIFPKLGIGKDFSGEVVQVSSDVSKFKIGDNVFGHCEGSFQEYIVTKEKWVHLMPTRVKFEQAASLPLAGCTVYQALTYFAKNEKNKDENIYNEFGFEPDLAGKNILVIGASGGTGYLAIQIAKFLNANEVYGVCSNNNVEIIKSLGVCEDVIAYDSFNFEQNLAQILKNESGEPKIDLILDTVSSREDGDVGHLYINYLKPDGKYVAINSSSIIKFCAGLIHSLIPKLNLEQKGTHIHFLNRDDGKGLEILSKMIEQGKITFFTNNVFFDYQAIEEAIKMLKSRRTKGKLVCNIIDDNINF